MAKGQMISFGLKNVFPPAVTLNYGKWIHYRWCPAGIHWVTLMKLIKQFHWIFTPLFIAKSRSSKTTIFQYINILAGLHPLLQNSFIPEFAAQVEVLTFKFVLLIVLKAGKQKKSSPDLHTEYYCRLRGMDMWKLCEQLTKRSLLTDPQWVSLALQWEGGRVLFPFDGEKTGDVYLPSRQ